MGRKAALAVIAAASLALAQAASAETLGFGPDLTRAGWISVSFPWIAPASFKASNATTLEISTDSSAGLLWRRLSQANRNASAARWAWRVDEGVRPLDLTKRGADDRAVAVYFVFGSAEDAAKAPMGVLASSSVTALVYVFGGNKPRGSTVPSPHMGSRGIFVVLRPADAPKKVWFEESIDLAEDYARVFGRKPPLLLAVAVSSDSDDSGERNRALLRDLRIGK